MANGDTQDNIAAGVASDYDRPIAVSVISKLSRFPFLQELGYNGQLGFLQKGFLGLQDYNDQLSLYSSSSPLLTAAWNLIKPIAPLNLDVQRDLVESDSLGTVGDVFEQVVGFDQVFAVDPSELSSSTGDSVVSDNLPGS